MVLNMVKFGLSRTRLRLFRWVVGLRALFYVVFRVWLGPWALMECVRIHGIRPFMAKFAKLPLLVSAGNVFNVSFLSYMNIVWTKQALERVQRLESAVHSSVAVSCF